jgi:hypothetical protein
MRLLWHGPGHDEIVAARAWILMKSEPWPYPFILTRFLDANRCPLRSKTL